jgi:DNA modification methylase
MADWPADRVERWPVAKLVPNARNARTHSDEQIAQLAASIEEWGWTIPVLVDEAGGIIAGHGRVMAAYRLGLEDVPVMVAAGWSDAKKRAYMLADNKLTLNSEWNLEQLAIEIAGLRASDFDISLIGFNESEIDALLKADDGGLTDPDEAPDQPCEPVSALGDVWLLGGHRIVCGDCTNQEVVEKTLNGAKPHLMVTDPPYGIMLDPSWRDRVGINLLGRSGRGGRDYMDGGRADTEARFDGAWALFPGDVCYVWCASARIVDVWQAISESGLIPHQILVWNKNVLTRTRTHYWYTHEFCIYAWRKSKTAHWVGNAGQASVWDVASPKHIMGGSKEENWPHPAQKPVECMKRPIENNSSPGQAVYDPFVGSGTTIIAAEMTGRCCHAIELHPAYVDVSVLRWQNFTGLEARLEATGETFAEVAVGRLAHAAGSAMSATKTARASKAKAGASPAA